MAPLRGEFGPEAHLSVARANKGVLVMAARGAEMGENLRYVS